MRVLAFIILLNSMILAESKFMGKVSPTKKVDIEKIQKENALIREILMGKFKEEVFSKMAKMAEEKLDENVKKMEKPVQDHYEKASFNGQWKKHQGETKVIKAKFPLGSMMAHGKKLIFFSLFDEDGLYDLLMFIRSSDPKMSLGFCFGWDQNKIKRFSVDTKNTFMFSAMTNVELLKEYKIESLPCVITVLDKEMVEVQYGF